MKKEKKLFSRLKLIKKKYKKKQFYYFFKIPNVSLMVPLINNKFLIVAQKREPINKTNLEFPCGWVDKDETPSKAAAREMLEETGYKSLIKPRKLIEFYEEPGRMNSKAICFFTNKLKKIKKGEKGIKCQLVSKKKLIRLIENKKFNNGSHIAAFYAYLNKK
tara:strand:- start:180 stop:665 length:486 start_codon:yes stop_codon:yes gene_type:complete